VDTGAVRLNEFDVFDAVLQDAHGAVVVAQRGQPRARLADLGRLDRKQHQFDGPLDLTRIGAHWRWHHDALAGQDRGIWPDVEMGTGRPPAQQRRVSGLVQARRDGRTDRARSDDRNAYAHLRQATALAPIQKHSSAVDSGDLSVLKPFPLRCPPSAVDER
jgi:hypothetical protein